MIKSTLVCLVLLLVGLASAQQMQLSQEQLNDPALLVQLNNYFGCRVWSGDACIECSDRYYFNKNGVCCEVKGTCQQFNLQEGICEKCYEGYSVVNGNCEQVDINQVSNIGCAIWASGVCTSCSKRWFFNADSVCVPVSDLCSTWDEVSGACATCYYGSIVVDGNCVANTDTSVVPESNLLCNIWDKQVCLECAARSFFNADGLCVSVSSQCNTFDKATGNCITCFAGYDIVDGACVYSPANTAAPSDLGCGTWDWNNQVCLACSNKWAFNADKICVPVADQCQANAENGDCTVCYKGYDLKDGQCLFSLSNNAKPADLGCGTWDWDNQVCLACSNGWVFNADKACVAVSDQCQAHADNGDCTACYKGYDLKNGQCVFSDFNNAKPSDVGCGTWDWNNQVCLACSNAWFFNADKICVPVSDQCAAHAANGDCTACYKGYDLKSGQCLFSEFNNAKPSDSGCATWNWDSQVCLACSNQWVFNADKICVPVSDQCAAHAANGDCTSCFKGYDLKNGQCLFSEFNNAKPADSGCATWDWDNQVCLACSNQWVFNADKICVPVSDQCAAHAANGDCTACFKGYDLKAGQCIFSDFNNAKPSDSGCATWDWDNQVCLACSNQWVFNADKICVPVSDQCAAHAANGDCTSCFKGYDLKNGQCLFSEFNNAKPADSGCATWDWDNQVCLACSNQWVFNADKICVPVSDQCAAHAANGDCTACFKGYDLKAGQCIFSDFNNAKPSDSGCATWDWDNQVCLACSNQWVFNADKICVPVSDQCAAHAANGDCTSCFKGYDLKNGQCIFSDFNNAKPSDSGCATWDWDNQVCLACSNQWVFNADKICVPVSDQCAAHAANGDCTACFKGYDLKAGQCIFSDFNNAKPSDSGCATWDWDNQVCLACSNQWVFNADKICVPVSDQCAAHAANGDCTSCFKGYDLKNGQCLFSEFNNAKPSDSGCATWDWDNQVCLACSNQWVFNADKICVPVSDQCAAHAANGDCTSCFKGYDLKNGQCLFSEFNNAKPADSGCATWDWDNQVCLACSNQWVFNADKICVPVSDQCAAHAANGDCTACFKGYDLKNGQCLFSEFNNAKPSDSGCATWDWDNQVCLACSNQWVFNADKICVPVSDQCAAHAANGDCTACFKGYDLKNGQCLFSEFNNAKPSDSGCATWDWDNQVCLACSNGFVFNAKKVCVATSDLCQSYDSVTGDCTACFEGYDLKNGQCAYSDFNNARPTDLGCATWDWNNQVCLKCSHRWFFNSQKRCVPVDDNCNNYAKDGSCSTCYPGYAIQGGVCLSVNPLCKTLNENGSCASCYPQNVLNEGNCVPISKLANILLYYAECCPEKLAQLKAQAGK